MKSLNADLYRKECIIVKTGKYKDMATSASFIQQPPLPKLPIKKDVMREYEFQKK